MSRGRDPADSYRCITHNGVMKKAKHPNKVKTFRAKLDMTQRALADAVGVSQQHIVQQLPSHLVHLMRVGAC
jgi:putative heme iron utilization protein